MTISVPLILSGYGWGMPVTGIPEMGCFGISCPGNSFDLPAGGKKM